MKQIIKFIDTDVDGCGTNIEIMIQIKGKHEITNGVIRRIEDVIEKYKKDNEGEWDTDSIIITACEHLKTEGYTCCYIAEDATIEF